MATKYKIPTGYLLVDEYSRGQLETLSIGDYGKSHNVKADFLGFTKKINGVPNGKCMPLSEKWVITLSTQYGCSMNCNFCDCPNVLFNGSVSFADLKNQLINAIKLFPDVRYTERLNIHFARMGEPMYNHEVFSFAKWLYTNKRVIQYDIGLATEVIHPVLTTSLPKGLNVLQDRLLEWCDIKNILFNGQAGLQLSINSTEEAQRSSMFNDRQISLTNLSEIADKFPKPLGRKYCLNFAYSTDFIIDAKRLANLFDVNKFMVKITPIHNNNACRKNNIQTVGGCHSYQPYQQVEEELKDQGFDVLIFIPSIDEENGLVTCGNAILGGGEIRV
jgi:23S rRNA (adenine2503-C2)-methyltransferase